MKNCEEKSVFLQVYNNYCLCLTERNSSGEKNNHDLCRENNLLSIACSSEKWRLVDIMFDTSINTTVESGQIAILTDKKKGIKWFELHRYKNLEKTKSYLVFTHRNSSGVIRINTVSIANSKVNNENFNIYKTSLKTVGFQR